MHCIQHCKPLLLPESRQTCTVTNAAFEICCRVQIQSSCKLTTIQEPPRDLDLKTFFFSTIERRSVQDPQAHSYERRKRVSVEQSKRAGNYCTSSNMHRKQIIPNTNFCGNFKGIYITALQQEVACPRRYSAFAAAAAACTAWSNVMESERVTSTCTKRDSEPSICREQLHRSADGLLVSKDSSGILRHRLNNSEIKHEESGRVARNSRAQTAALHSDNNSRALESSLTCKQCTHDGTLASGRHSVSRLSSDIHGGKSSSSIESGFSRRRNTVNIREHSCAESVYAPTMPERYGECRLRPDAVDRNGSGYSKLDQVREVQFALHAALSKSESPEEILQVSWKYLAAIRKYSHKDHGVTAENASRKSSEVSRYSLHVTAQEAADFGLVNTAHALHQLVRVAARGNRLKWDAESETGTNDGSSVSSIRFPLCRRSSIDKRSVQYNLHRTQQRILLRDDSFTERTPEKKSQESRTHNQFYLRNDVRFLALLQCAQHHLHEFHGTISKCKASTDVKPPRLRFLASLCWVYGKLKLFELCGEEKGWNKVEETNSRENPTEKTSLFVHSCLHVAESSNSAGRFAGNKRTSGNAEQFSDVVGNEETVKPTISEAKPIPFNQVSCQHHVADAVETVLFLLGKCVRACLPLFSTCALPVALWGLAQAQYGTPRQEYKRKFELKKNSISSPANTLQRERVSNFEKQGAEEYFSFLKSSVVAAVGNRDAISPAACARSSPSKVVKETLSSIGTEDPDDAEALFWEEAAKSLKTRVQSMSLRLIATAAHACAAVEFRDEELLHAFATRAVELLVRSRQEALSPSLQFCGEQSREEHSTEENDQHSTFQQHLEIPASCASTTRAGPVLVSDYSTPAVYIGDFRGESGEESRHEVAYSQKRNSVTACRASSLADETGFGKHADSDSIGGSLSILLSSFVKLGVSSTALFSVIASLIVADCFRSCHIFSSGISLKCFSSSTVKSPPHLSLFGKRFYLMSKHCLESGNTCKRKANVKLEVTCEKGLSRDISGTLAKTAVEPISAQCFNSFLFRLKPLEVTAFAWAFAHSCVDAVTTTKLENRRYEALHAHCYSSRKSTQPTKGYTVRGNEFCSRGSSRIHNSADHAPTHIRADSPFIQKWQISPEIPAIENIDSTLVLPYTLWTVFTVLRYLAIHSLERHHQYTLADKVRFCWALAVHDLFVPMLFQSVVSTLEQRHYAEQLQPRGDVPSIANCKKTSDCSHTETSHISNRRVKRGHATNQYNQETPSQNSPKADSSARARRLQKVQKFVEVWNRTGNPREGNLEGVEPEAYGGGGTLKTQLSSNDALNKSCRGCDKLKSNYLSEIHKPFENHLLSFQLQTQLYFALLCLITRKSDEGILVYPDQYPQVRTSAYGVGKSRLPKSSSVFPKQPSCSLEYSNAQSIAWAVIPPEKKCVTSQITHVENFLYELEEGKNNAHLLPTTFFRCRASLNTHPNRSENCRTSRQHVQVLSVLRRVMQGKTYKSSLGMNSVPRSDVAIGHSSNKFYGNNDEAGRYISQMGSEKGQFTSSSRRLLCKPVLCTKIDQMEGSKDVSWKGWQAIAEYRDVSGFWLDAVLKPPKIQVKS